MLFLAPRSPTLDIPGFAFLNALPVIVVFSFRFNPCPHRYLWKFELFRHLQQIDAERG